MSVTWTQRQGLQPAMTRSPDLPEAPLINAANYAGWLTSLKTRIDSARHAATLAVNHELVRLYHHIGVEILERQERHGWGG